MIDLTDVIATTPANQPMKKTLFVAFCMWLLPVFCFGSITSQVSRTGPVVLTVLPITVAVGFPFQQASDLQVFDIGPVSAPLSVFKTLVLNSDYTVTGGGYNTLVLMQTGSITVSSAGSNSVAVNDQIVIIRNVPINQTTSFSATGPLTMSLIEQALDKNATISQELNELASRSIRFIPGETLNGQLPAPSLRANTIFSFSSTGAINLLPVQSVTQPTDISNNLVTAIGGTTAQTLGTRFSQIMNVKDFGAKGDGTTDDTAALNAALTAAIGGTLRFPNGTYLTTGLTYNVATHGSIAIVGDGPNSIIEISGAGNGGIHLVGTAGNTGAATLIENIGFISAAGSTPAYAIHLDGLANFQIYNVWINGSAAQMTKGIWLTAAQQGQVSGGSISGCLVGGYLEASNDGTVRSNGVDWHGMTFNCIGTGTINFQIAVNDSSGGADDISFHSNHLTNASMQMDLYGALGLLNIFENHLEPSGSNNGLILRAGYANIVGNSFFGTATDLNLQTANGTALVTNNIINGNVNLQSGGIVFAFNVTVGTVTDNTGGSLRNFNNSALGGSPILTSVIYTPLTVLDNGAAGDMLTLAPGGSVGGSWGMTIKGAGTNSDIYSRYGVSGPVVAGNTGDGSLHFKSAPGGSDWASVSSTGLNVAGGTTPVLHTNSAATSGAGTGAGTLTNAPSAGNPTKWVPFNDGGTIRYIPMW